jgi:hypothetical protein
MRVTGIRRVDARTGSPESMRSAVIRTSPQTALQAALTRVGVPDRRRFKARASEHERLAGLLRERLAHDPDALERALGDVGRAHGRGCLIALARAPVLGRAHALIARFSSRRQTAIDRLAGVAVIRDARRSTSR